MTSVLFRCVARRCFSVYRTDTSKPTTPPKPKLNKETQITAFKEDIDQKHVVVPSNRDLYSPDTSTHTGQVYDSDDYRNARFLNKGKLINPRFAIDLIADDPVVVCEARGVWSDSGGPLGHPKVYINLDKPTVHSCGYSGRKFIQAKYYDESKHGPSITYNEYVQQVRNEADFYNDAALNQDYH
ncbi:unnamed protein product [Didymodactylos carnosus]|uniref:Zinc finger CHCC-type domain-containing protein n=1 Tax=Didymodactylos carnosus TaxID=1234261 RepID=A0A814QMR6_9BILA|nr:unnamed protein product [Didymodactylos carnosus]CAF1122421.1 unnamed protein product [Didymodactylos carnosus]CAF3695007.1 unnamed protein product [Didymodactylos carnosus]CAF3885962.1 unnamed protein product [Didymodactylos carnosus]